MPTIRGFVEAIEIGRAGLVTVFILHADGTNGAYNLADLDADPERFNERLSKLGLLRDALDRAEPVEIEFGDTDMEAGSILRVRRLSRDVLARPGDTQRINGMIVGVGMGVVNITQPQGEQTDIARLTLLANGSFQSFILPMQIPERIAAASLVDVALAAQVSGSEVSLQFDAKTHIIVGLDTTTRGRGAGRDEATTVAGYVESISPTAISNLMIVNLTSAPAFKAEGNTVPLVGFIPTVHSFLMARGSVEYELSEAALRDTLRLEVSSTVPPDDIDEATDRDEGSESFTANIRGVSMVAAHDEDPPENGKILLVNSAKLDAPLSSASRPVWIEIDSQAMDIGPDGDCVEGLPSHDLRPQSLRQIDLPYSAEWHGLACFNRGVYRFQISTTAIFTMSIDGEPVCLHFGEKEQLWFAHACLAGDHEVVFHFENWKCSRKFDMDAYRVR